MQHGWKLECASLCPSPSQELLLQAAVNGDAGANEAFQAWKQATQFARYSDIDFASMRLLPAVYHNFRRLGIEDSWMAQMAALHRYHWLRNTNAQRALLQAAQQFAANDCRYVLLGGFAMLAGGYYDDLGERPLIDAEMLVPVEDATIVRRSLESLGWHDAATVPSPVPGWRSEWWCAPDGQSLRVHFRWLPKPFPVVQAEQVLARAESFEMNGVRLRVADAADMLAYTCIANRRPARDASHRFLWALGAWRILERAGDRLDWRRLGEESRAFRTLFPLSESLGYLATTFGAPVPGDWQAMCRKARIGAYEKQPFYRCTRQWSGFARTLRPRGLRFLWDDYAAAEKVAGRTPASIELLRYWRWHLKSEVARAMRHGKSEANEPTDRSENAAEAA